MSITLQFKMSSAIVQKYLEDTFYHLNNRLPRELDIDSVIQSTIDLIDEYDNNEGNSIVITQDNLEDLFTQQLKEYLDRYCEDIIPKIKDSKSLSLLESKYV